MSADLNTILPEIILAIYAMGALIVAVYTGKDALARPLIWLTAAVLAVVALWVALSSGSTHAFNGMIVKDAFARFAQVTILLSAAVVLVIGQDYMARTQMLKFEYPLLIVLSVIGMMVMVSSGNLLTIYMGLELQSLALYVVASMRRDNLKSTEEIGRAHV